MLKQKIDQIAVHHGREGEDDLRVDIIDIVREAIGEMKIKERNYKFLETDTETPRFWEGHKFAVKEFEAKAEEILNQLK